MTDHTSVSSYYQLHSPTQAFLRQYWYGVLLVVGLLVFALAQLIRMLTPRPPVPIQQNSWQGVTPGHSKLIDVQEKFGQPIDRKDTVEGSRLSYSSVYKYQPHQVVTDREQTVVFMKEYLPPRSPEKLSTYTEKFGQPDLELYTEEADSAKAYVFLDEGLVLIAHVADGTLEQKWYFEPTTQEKFIDSWGKTLESEPEGPEGIIP